MPWPALALGGSIAGLVSTIGRFLIPYLIIKLLVGLGVTGFSIAGSIWLSNYVETTVITQFNSIPGDLGVIAVRAGFLDAFLIIFNCWVIAINIKIFMGRFKGFKLL